MDVLETDDYNYNVRARNRHFWHYGTKINKTKQKKKIGSSGMKNYRFSVTL